VGIAPICTGFRKDRLMSVASKKRRIARAGAVALKEIAAIADIPASPLEIEDGQTLEGSVTLDDDQKLHGAIFEAAREPETVPTPAESSLEAPVVVALDPLDRKILELLDKIGQEFQADDATNFEKLNIARRCGPLLWDLKALAPHGTFKQKLRERFPKVNYAKCNRWMFLAKHEAEVVAAIEKYPDVAWGPKKMIDYLKNFWTPVEEGEDDEDDCFGNVREDHIEDESLIPDQDAEGEEVPAPAADSPFAIGALNPDLAKEIEENQQQSDNVPPGATAGPITQAVRTPHRPARNTPANRPAVNRTEYEVEVRIGFKLSVPENVTPEAVTEAIRIAERWTVGIDTPFEYEMSEKAIVVGHVRPWDGLEEIQPEPIPNVEVVP